MKLETFGILVGFVLFTVSFTTFWLGYHSVDSGFNMVSMEKEFRTSIMDCGSEDNCMTGQEWYSRGLRQIRFSIPGLIYSPFLIGHYLKETGGK